MHFFHRQRSSRPHHIGFLIFLVLVPMLLSALAPSNSGLIVHAKQPVMTHEFTEPVRLVNSWPGELQRDNGAQPYGPYGRGAADLSRGMGVPYHEEDPDPFLDLYAHYIGADDGFDPAVPAFCAQYDIMLDGTAYKTPMTSFDKLTVQQQYAITLALAFAPDLRIAGYCRERKHELPKETYLSWLAIQQLVWNIAGSDANGYQPIGAARQENDHETNAADLPLLSGQALKNAKALSRETGSYDKNGTMLRVYQETSEKVLSAASFAAHTLPLSSTALSLKQAEDYETSVNIGKGLCPSMLSLSCSIPDVDLSYDPDTGLLSVSIPLDKASAVSGTVNIKHLLPEKNDSAIYFGGGGQIVTAHSAKTVLTPVSLALTVEQPRPAITPFQLDLTKQSSAGKPLSDAVFEVRYEPLSSSVTDSMGDLASERTWYIKSDEDGQADFNTLDESRENSPLFLQASSNADASTTSPLGSQASDASAGFLIPAGTLTIQEIQAPDGYQRDETVVTLSSVGDGFRSPVRFEAGPILFANEPSPLTHYATKASWSESALQFDPPEIQEEISSRAAEDTADETLIKDDADDSGSIDTNDPACPADTGTPLLRNELSYQGLQKFLDSDEEQLFILDMISWEGASTQEPYQIHTELFDVNDPEKIIAVWEDTYSFPDTSGTADLLFSLEKEDAADLPKNGTWQLRQALTIEDTQVAEDTSVSEQIHITHPELTKTVETQSHSLDEEIPFFITFTVPGSTQFPASCAKIIDSLPPQLDFIGGSAVLMKKNEPVPESFYVLKYHEKKEEEQPAHALTFSLTEEGLTACSGQELVLSYRAKMNELTKAAEPICNTALYTSHTQHFVRELKASTEVYTGQIQLTKTNEEGEPLEQARFQLLNEDGSIYSLHRSGSPEGTDYLVTSGADGRVCFTGLSDGTYLIDELEAPEGYKREKTPVKVTVENGTLTQDSPIEIENGPLPVLNTGGRGPVQFLPALLLLGLAVFLAIRFKKRQS